MNLFVINSQKCKKDFMCVNECPLECIEIKDSVPVLSGEGADLCIKCGHCAAVCPNDALYYQALNSDKFQVFKKELIPGFEQTEHFLRAKRSIRRYKDKPVEKDVLLKLLDIASCAPSGHNRQPVKWSVFYEKEKVRELAGMVVDWAGFMIKDKPEFAAMMHMDRLVKGWEEGKDPICRNAPHVIIAHANGQESPAAPMDSAAALTYFSLAAFSYGIGTCWAGFLNAASLFWPPLQERLQLPSGHTPMGSMMVGYPQYRFKKIPNRNKADISWK